MKRKIIGICIGMLMIATTVPAVGTKNDYREQNTAMFFPPGVDWMETYGGEEFNWIFDIKKSTTDDGYIAGGIQECQNRMCAWMLKIDKNGTEEWSTINDLWYGLYPVQDEISVQCVLPIEDGFLAGGYGYYNDTGDTIVGYLWKVNLTGETQWLKGLWNETEIWSVSPFDMIQVDDEIICCGWQWYQTTPPNIELDAAWFKTDLDGNLDESSVHNYDSGGWDWVRSIWVCDDGGYFLAGSTDEPNPSVDLGAAYIIKTDSNGNKEWDQIFDGPAWDSITTHGCRQTSDGGYIIAGNSGSYGDTMQDLWIVKTNALGNMTWNKTYGGEHDDYCLGMDAVDGGYVFVVIKDAWKSTDNLEDLQIIETDEDGNKTWEFTVFEPGIQWIQSIHQIEDGGFIVAGRNGHLNSPDCSGLIMEIAPFPRFTIDISGGLGVIATITNNGAGDAVNVPCEITVQGGILGLVNKVKSEYLNIPVGDLQTVSTGLFFGLGPVTITVEVGVIETTTSGKMFGPFVFGVS